jgi:hypothetical protein
MYRLSINIGNVLTSASYEMADESQPLGLSSSAEDLSSARFITDGRLQVDLLADALRGIVTVANDQLGEIPGSVAVSYPVSWDSNRLILLWEALVLAGIPDAATVPVAEAKPLVAAPAPTHVERSPVDDSPAAPALRAASRPRLGWLAVAAILNVTAGMAVGVISTFVLHADRTPVVEEVETSSSPVPAADVDLPVSDPLAAQQFIVPRGKNAATQLTLANVAGVVRPRTLSTAAGRNSWPLLSADRRTIIYINYVAGATD